MAVKQLSPTEISELIKQRIEQFDLKPEVRSEGTIVSVKDGIVRLYGLEDVMQGEMVEFPGNVYGLALNLERDSVGAVILGRTEDLSEGQTAKCTGRICSDNCRWYRNWFCREQNRPPSVCANWTIYCPFGDLPHNHRPVHAGIWRLYDFRCSWRKARAHAWPGKGPAFRGTAPEFLDSRSRCHNALDLANDCSNFGFLCRIRQVLQRKFA